MKNNNESQIPDDMEDTKHNKVYSNKGNTQLINLLSDVGERLLDIGCGAGDNAALIKAKFAKCVIFGITHSANEAELALKHIEHCWVFDLDGKVPDDLAIQSFDTLLFSHVLEHLRDPDVVLASFSQFLHAGGQILIAVPNILSWRMRCRFLFGRFEYEKEGVLDDTHLRFFTYYTAEKYLLSKSTNLVLREKVVSGSVPLWWFRRYIFPASWCTFIDNWACRRWPNLFGDQVLMRVVKK